MYYRHKDHNKDLLGIDELCGLHFTLIDENYNTDDGDKNGYRVRILLQGK